jgi:CO/xanthine dehydrogenase Mo-binding subunit
LPDYDQGKLPMGKTPDEWSYGDVDAGFKNAALVLDETFVTPNTSHQTLEPRTAMAYWQNGKLYIHCSTQSVVQTVGSVSRWMHLDPQDVVLISEYTGGGFGSKATGTITSMIPAMLSKKLNAPVMMRIDRETEHYIGGARPGMHGRLKSGSRRTDASPRSTCSSSTRMARTRLKATRANRARRSRCCISRRRCGGAASQC